MPAVDCHSKKPMPMKKKGKKRAIPRSMLSELVGMAKKK